MISSGGQNLLACDSYKILEQFDIIFLEFEFSIKEVWYDGAYKGCC